MTSNEENLEHPKTFSANIKTRVFLNKVYLVTNSKWQIPNQNGKMKIANFIFYFLDV